MEQEEEFILKDESSGNYIKDTNPYQKYEDKTIQNDVIRFYLQYSHLKNLYRQGWLKNLIGMQHKEKCESVADHCWSLALLAISIIEKYELDYDISKCMKLAIVHELGEIYAGDYTPNEQITSEQKHQLEKKAIQRMLGQIDFKNDFLQLWEEFEQKKTKEAIFMKELDQLEFLMQSTVHELDVSYLKTSRKKVTLPILQEIVDELIKITEGKQIPKDAVGKK